MRSLLLPSALLLAALQESQAQYEACLQTMRSNAVLFLSEFEAYVLTMATTDVFIKDDSGLLDASALKQTMLDDSNVFLPTYLNDLAPTSTIPNPVTNIFTQYACEGETEKILAVTASTIESSNQNMEFCMCEERPDGAAQDLLNAYCENRPGRLKPPSSLVINFSDMAGGDIRQITRRLCQRYESNWDNLRGNVEQYYREVGLVNDVGGGAGGPSTAVDPPAVTLPTEDPKKEVVAPKPTPAPVVAPTATPIVEPRPKPTQSRPTGGLGSLADRLQSNVQKDLNPVTDDATPDEYQSEPDPIVEDNVAVDEPVTPEDPVVPTEPTGDAVDTTVDATGDAVDTTADGTGDATAEEYYYYYYYDDATAAEGNDNKDGTAPDDLFAEETTSDASTNGDGVNRDETSAAAAETVQQQRQTNGPSTTILALIGVGIGLGSFLIMAICGFCIFRKFCAKKREVDAEPEYEGEEDPNEMAKVKSYNSEGELVETAAAAPAAVRSKSVWIEPISMIKSTDSTMSDREAIEMQCNSFDSTYSSSMKFHNPNQTSITIDEGASEDDDDDDDDYEPTPAAAATQRHEGDEEAFDAVAL